MKLAHGRQPRRNMWNTRSKASTPRHEKKKKTNDELSLLAHPRCLVVWTMRLNSHHQRNTHDKTSPAQPSPTQPRCNTWNIAYKHPPQNKKRDETLSLSISQPRCTGRAEKCYSSGRNSRWRTVAPPPQKKNTKKTSLLYYLALMRGMRPEDAPGRAQLDCAQVDNDNMSSVLSSLA